MTLSDNSSMRTDEAILGKKKKNDTCLSFGCTSDHSVQS